MRRCVGVGKCRNTSGGGVMCPSYRATREEQHSTRGRAHLLAEMINGEVIKDGWRSSEVHDALDLCLSCKGCLSDCPVDVDMATYKAEFLHQHYRRRLRPASHYSMGWLPLWLRAQRADAAAGQLRRGGPGWRALVKRLGGIAPERALPSFAPAPFTSSRADLRRRASGERRVVLWPDSFNNYLTPSVLDAAHEVLTAAGYDVVLPDRGVCCGLTWVSTGQLGVARRVLDPDAFDVLRAVPRRRLRGGRAGTELHGPVPRRPAGAAARRRACRGCWRPGRSRSRSCWSGRRSRSRALDVDAITQVHCHQHAVLGFGADESALAAAGVRNTTLDSGCCGLAGNFGFERGHYEVSKAVAEDRMLPAIRAASAETVVVSDGFSCRTQIEQESGRQPVHLAELLRRALP